MATGMYPNATPNTTILGDKLDTLHTDVATTLGGKLDTLGTKLDTLHNDFIMNTRMAEAMSGDMVLVCTPATLGSSAAAVNAAIAGAGAKFQRTITCSLKNANGDAHIWYNGTIDISEAEVTNGDGAASINGGGSTVTLVAGVGSVTLDYVGAWAAADTETLTFGNNKMILGKTLTNATSVDTLIA